MENRIKLLRKEKDISQEELAAIIGVVRTTITGYERGIIFPAQDKLILLSEYFNVSADYIIGKSDIRARCEFNSHDIYNGFNSVLDLLNSSDDTYFAGTKLTDEQKHIFYTMLHQNILAIKEIIENHK